MPDALTANHSGATDNQRGHRHDGRRLRPRLSGIGLLALMLLAIHPRTAASAPWVAGDYVGYQSSSYPPSAIDFSSLTQVNVFAVEPNANGTLDTTLFIDAVNGPLVARSVASLAHAAGRKAVLVVGGAGTEAQFKGATSATYMSTFVQSLVSTTTAWGFDGIDIDWESLPSSDYAAMLSLIAKLRAASPGIMVTADVGWLNSNFALSSGDAQFYASLGAAVDQMNIMTYGMADAWSGWVSWHSSAIYNQGPNHPSSVSSSVLGYLGAGVPAAKLGIGIGFYGSCWNPPVTAPLQSPGASHVVASDNTLGFAGIKNLYYNPANYFVDPAAQAPYLSFSSATGPSGCTFLSYEDEASVAQKAQYVLTSGLGGALIWQLNEGYNPSASDPSSLLHAVGTAFLGGTSTLASTTTTLASPVNPTAFGQAATLTATVAVTAPGNGSPTGVVTFRDGTTTIGSATLNGGIASMSIATLTVGTHSLTASYGGSSSDAASTSTALVQTVHQAATKTTLISSRNPSKKGQSVTFTATVSVVAPGAGPLSGTVLFVDGKTQIGSASLSNGKASFQTSALASGSHAMTAAYQGVANQSGSTSAALTQTIK